MPDGSTLRHHQANAVRQRILSAAIEVIEAGEEPSMRAVAVAAAISERTLYRYFGSREELHAALVPIVREQAGAPMAADVDGLPEYIRRLFTTFDRNAQLARALTTAAWFPGHATRPANLRALRKVVDRAFPRAPKAHRESAAAGLRALYSASSWVYLTDCGLDLEASIRHVQWMTSTVLEKLSEVEDA